MSFFDMGPLEILLILLIALIVWGPGKIPEIARIIGRAVSTLRKASFDLTTQVKRELEEEEKTKLTESNKNVDNKVEGTSDTGVVPADDKETPGQGNS